LNPSSQTPEVTRGCDLRGAENRGRSTCYASYVDEPVMMVSGAGTKHYFHQNHLYSVAAMTNSTGAVVERYRYDAYGKRTVTNAGGTPIAASTIGQQRGFTGYYLDAETGLYYARYRMYSGSLGQFVGRDQASFRSRSGINIPHARMGYHDGFSLYRAYFAPNKLDPSGAAAFGFEDSETLWDNDTWPNPNDKLATFWWEGIFKCVKRSDNTCGIEVVSLTSGVNRTNYAIEEELFATASISSTPKGSNCIDVHLQGFATWENTNILPGIVGGVVVAAITVGTGGTVTVALGVGAGVGGGWELIDTLVFGGDDEFAFFDRHWTACCKCQKQSSGFECKDSLEAGDPMRRATGDLFWE